MKKIAITQRLIKNDSYFEIREALDIRYGKLVQACGFLPIVLPYEVDFRIYFDMCDIDGVLLTGGNDLSSLVPDELSKKRDCFEKELIRYCIEHEIPLFGVCRGMQVVVEYFGGGLKKVDGEVNAQHKLIVNRESKYVKYLTRFDKVNSFHHFALDELSSEFNLAATNERGIIKAIEHKTHRIFCQMWHSERDDTFDLNAINLIRDFFNFGLDEVIEIAQRAGEAVMQIYEQEFDVDYKEDSSPITIADLKANEIITEGLHSISAYPVVTEETPVAFEVRKNWSRFWLVDPLDGTKDFIAKNGEFTINISLINENKPILGVVYIPSKGDVYYAVKNGGAFKNGKKIFNSSKRTELIAADSNFHSTPKTQVFFEKYKIQNIYHYGSSIKICKLAEGEIDLYPRLNGTKEWDTAAAHIIANEAGCKLVDSVTNKELIYNKEDMQNNYFVASRNDLEFQI